MDERTCQWCGRVYTPKRRDQRMCGGYCSTRYPEARAVPRLPIACEWCGTSFVPAHRAHRFCAPVCKRRAKAPPRFAESRTCAWCGAAFTATQPTGKFCSRRCKHSGTRADWHERKFGGSAEYWRHYNRTPARAQWLEVNKASTRERKREASRLWRIAHPDLARARYASYRERHREYFRQREALRRALKRAGPGSVPVTKRDWIRLLRRYDYCCAYCGGRPTTLQVDHVVPIARGGRNGIGNGLPACAPCNMSKGSKLLVEWRLRSLKQRARVA